MRTLSFMEARMTAATENIGKSVLVYDVGGSHVSAAVCLQNGYQLGPVVSALHPAQQTSDALIQLLYALGIEAGADTARVAGAELAMPGPFDFAAGVSQMRHKLPYLFGLDLRQKLSQRFGWPYSELDQTQLRRTVYGIVFGLHLEADDHQILRF